MKYVVVVFDPNLMAVRVIAAPGGGWLDLESAKAWADGQLATSHYQVLPLEYPP